MKRLSVVIFLVLALRFYAAAQPGVNPIRYVTADPTGTACAGTSIALRTTNGNVYTCVSGVYALLAGGGSGGSSGTIAYAAGGGTAQAQTATYSPALTLTQGQWACWLPTAANTGADPTFAPNGLTAHTIVKAGGALVANDIITTAQACAIYNTTGTQWELQNPQTGPAVIARGLVFAIGGTGSGVALTNTSQSATLTIPYGCTIGTPAGSKYSIALGSGDIGTLTVKFWKIASGSAIPTVANVINTSGLSLSTGTAIQSSTFSDFTSTAVSASDMMIMNITAISGTINSVLVVLPCGS